MAKRQIKKAKKPTPKKRIKKRKKVRAVTVLADALTEARTMGRPIEYKPEWCELVEKLCHLGATDIEIADFLKISGPTLYEWQARYPEFSKSIKMGKETADTRVERSLYSKATGYTFDSEKLFYDAKTGEVVRAKTREHVPPSDTAMIFFLKNRKPADYRDKQDVQHNHAHLNLGTTPMSIAEAQEMFRAARNMPIAELERQLGIQVGVIEVQAETLVPVDVSESTETEDSDAE